MKKYFQYLRYVIIHKYHVARFCFKYDLYWRGIKHDWSKFLPDEWGPYMNYFYCPKGKPDNFEKDTRQWLNAHHIKSQYQMEFDQAWLFHQHRNDHHFQHWILRCDDRSVRALPMPYEAMMEMIADWCGAGIAITGKLEVWDWYEKNKEKILLHPATRIWVELEIKLLKSEYGSA